MRLIIWSIILIFGTEVFAYTPFKQALTLKKNDYLADGVFTGGAAGSGCSLLAVRRVYSKKAQIERVIVDMGDRQAKPVGKKLGYFQASVDQKRMRIVLDLAQLQASAVTEPKLKELFAKSPYVASAEFTIDPEDKTGTIVLNMKQPMTLEVFESLADKKPARVVMDMRPLRTARAPVAVKKRYR